MNIDNLEVGNTYKNYRHLCEALGEQIKTGKSKKLQIENWERYFNYTKNGHSFTITEIYDTPEEKIDLRGKAKVEYIEQIEKLILDLLVQDGNDGQVFLSKNKLLRTLQMINDNYSFGKNKPLKLSKHMSITKEEINDFYEISDDMLKRNLEAALNNLRNKALIIWTNTLTVCHIETYIEYNNTDDVKALKREIEDEDGDLIVEFGVAKPHQSMVHRKATKEEAELILHTERELLKAYGFKTLSDVFKRNKSEQFYRDVRDVLFDQANIYLYYNSYEIISNKDQIIEEWEELEQLKLNRLDKIKTQVNLNNDIVERLNKNTLRRHEKAFDKFEKTKSKKYEMRISDNYIDNSIKLTETLIRRGAKSIRY